MMCKVIVILTLRVGKILKTDTIDGPDVSLLKSKLISELNNDPELAILFMLVLPPVELDKVTIGYYVRNWRPPNALDLRNGE